MLQFKQCIPSFLEKLKKVDVASISTEAYPAKYFKHLQQHANYFLHIHAFVLQEVFDGYNLHAETATLLDFGCGNGLLALFAKHCGIYSVHAIDAKPSFILAAQHLAIQLGIELEGWIIGDETQLAKHFAHTKPDIIVGTDVIEHIYDLSKFFAVLKGLSPNCITAFTTASVADNLVKSKKLHQLMLTDELKHSEILHAIDGDEFAGLSFLQKRKNIIAQHAPSLKENELNQLAKATRGLNKNDIIAAVDLYIEKGILPITIQHPYNTCDPISGSWTERILTLQEYQSIYNKAGYSLIVKNGFYDAFTATIKGFIYKLLNTILSINNQSSFTRKFSPFIFLLGKHEKHNL